MKDTIALLRESGAMLEGHFLLSSGRHGDRYFQCAKLLQYPDRAEEALKLVAEKIKKDMQSGTIKIDLIVGPAMGGIIVAYELARQLSLPAIFTERDDSGKMSLRRGFEIKEGENILIAEDVVTTAKSSRETAQALEEFGANISALVCIVDRRAQDVKVDWTFYSACKVSAESWETDACDLCKKGLPIVKPGSRKQ